MNANIFYISFIALLSALFVIRAYFRIRYRSIVDSVKYREENRWLFAFRAAAGTVMLYATLSSIYPPAALAFQFLSLPERIRTAGIPTGAAALLLLLEVHLRLGSSFSTSVHLKERHVLVTSGIYRYIRHPMYLDYCVFVLSTFLVSANWLFGASGILIISSLMTFRLRIEERLLGERFGEAYTGYTAVTGKFIPRLSTIRGKKAAHNGNPMVYNRRDEKGTKRP